MPPPTLLIEGPYKVTTILLLQMRRAPLEPCTIMFWMKYRVDWLVIEHLSAQVRLDPRGELCCFWCPNKTWTPPLGASDTITIVKNGLEMRKLWPPQIKGGQELKIKNNLSLNNTKADSQTPKKFLVCCSAANRVQSDL